MKRGAQQNKKNFKKIGASASFLTSSSEPSRSSELQVPSSIKNPDTEARAVTDSESATSVIKRSRNLFGAYLFLLTINISIN